MFRFKILLILNASGAGIFAFFAIIFPGLILELMGLEFSTSTYHLVRIMGVQLSAMMMVMWFLIWSESKPLLRSMALAFFIYNLIAVMVSVYFVWAEVASLANIMIIVMHGVLTLLYGYFSFKGRGADIPTVCD